MTEPGTDVPFLDDETAEAIGWASIWQSFAPVTSCGKAAKAALRPFLPGEEAAWREASAELALDAANCSADVLQKAAHILQACPDIRDALHTLRHTTGALTPKECLALKQFVQTGLQLSEWLTQSMRGLLSPARWASLLTAFGHTESSSFSIAHIAGPAYVEAGQAYAKAQRRCTEIQRELHRQVVTEAGVQPNRDGQLVLLLPQQMALVNDLKASPRLRWLRDTPFESVFEVVETEPLAAARADVERAESAMQAQTEAAMKQLSDELRGALPNWDAAAAQMTTLDLRIAKARLFQAWSGTVAESARYPQFVQAVQPLLDAQYRREGRRYVPLDWAILHGVNVLAGSNMGGKSLALQLLCICQCLAQYGLPLPANRAATRLYRAVRYSASADTEAEAGLSSFGAEMIRLTDVLGLLKDCGPILAVFDEPARSTNPREGEALVMGLLRDASGYIGDSLLMVATHFVAATKLRGTGQYRVRGLRGTEMFTGDGGNDGDRLQALADAMDYRLEAVESDTFAEEGLRIAAWLGVPQTVLAKAQAFLDEDSESGKGSGR